MTRCNLPTPGAKPVIQTLTIDDPENGGSEAGAWAKFGYATDSGSQVSKSPDVSPTLEQHSGPAK
jgi:hypothetical protein